MTQIAVKHLHKSFGNTPVLHDINLEIGSGEFVVFVGPSGCGKSTLLRLICGLDHVNSGSIVIDNEIVNDVPASRRGIAMVFQSYALYPHMSVAQNMGYALKLAGVARAEIDTRVLAAAKVLRLDPLLQRKPRELSGGQRQRVAIGRAIVREPRLFLFDEPLSNLDAALRVDMRTEIAALKLRLGTTMVYVTHDQIEAMTLADKIVVMHAGRIEQIGAPLDLYRRPANRFVATFIGSPRMNMLPGTVDAAGLVRLGNGSALPLRLHASSGAAVAIGIRAEHLALPKDPLPQGATLQGEVRLVEHLGSDVFVHVAIAGIEHWVIARHPGDLPVKSGQTIMLSVDPRNAHVFNADGMRMEPLAQGETAA